MRLGSVIVIRYEESDRLEAFRIGGLSCSARLFGWGCQGTVGSLGCARYLVEMRASGENVCERKIVAAALLVWANTDYRQGVGQSVGWMIRAFLAPHPSWRAGIKKAGLWPAFRGWSNLTSGKADRLDSVATQ